MPTSWTETDDQILRKWHKEGLTDHQIAEKMGWSDSTAHYHRRKLGLGHNFKPTMKLDARQVSMARQLCREGVPIRTIRRQLDTSDVAVRRAVKDILQAKQADMEAKADEICRLKTTEKLTGSQIAARMGITRNVVLGVLWRRGLGQETTGKNVAKIIKRAQGGKIAVVFQRDPYRGEAPTGCRYPEGEGASLKWCNAERRQGSPYCGHHHELTHISPKAQDDDVAA